MLNCLIIEDEPIAAEIIADYIQDVPHLHLAGICRDVFSASEYLASHQVDVLFVDIHLPKINGIDFIKTIQNKYQVILTTAYHQYALTGYDLNVVDYLLKPIEFSRFLQAVNKLTSVTKKVTAPIVSTESKSDFQFFNVGKKQVRVMIADIVFIESLKEYIKIHTADGSLTTKEKIGDIEAKLGPQKFIRIHKSYVINQEKIVAFSGREIDLGIRTLPIGRSYKESIKLRLES